MLQSPFLKLSKSLENKITLILLFLFIITIMVMQYFNAPLENDICENGIISFELAKELSKSQAILDSWNEHAKIAAGLSLGFDFLFLLIYSSFIALLIHKLNERLWKNKPFYRIGNILIWAIFLAALFDAIENVPLIILLLGDLQQYWSSIAYYFAVLKFIILIVVILYVLVNFGYFLIKKLSSK